jgi:hypothetical protein
MRGGLRCTHSPARRLLLTLNVTFGCNSACCSVAKEQGSMVVMVLVVMVIYVVACWFADGTSFV